MRGLAVTAVLLVILVSGCGPDNPFEPNRPSPSALTGVLIGGNARLSWNMCPDTDFAGYTLYRSASPGIQSNPGSASVLAVIENQTSTSYIDENISGKSYYALKTTNESGNSSWSNEVSVQPGRSGKLMIQQVESTKMEDANWQVLPGFYPVKLLLKPFFQRCARRPAEFPSGQFR